MGVSDIMQLYDGLSGQSCLCVSQWLFHIEMEGTGLC